MNDPEDFTVVSLVSREVPQPCCQDTPAAPRRAPQREELGLPADSWDQLGSVYEPQ